MPRPIQKLLLIGFGLVLTVLLLAVVEGALRLFGVGDETLYEDPFVGFAAGSDLFERRTLPSGEVVYATRESRLGFFNEQQFPADKPAGTYRIFALGGSTTAGRPYDAKVAFPAWLELYLNAAQPGRRFEVVNAGGISYASYRIVVLMKELVRYQPDLFLVYTGHNEFLEERSYSGIIHQHPTLKRLRIWLNGYRFYGLARRAWLDLRDREPSGEARLAAEVTARLDESSGLESYHRDDELEESIAEHFEYNLRQMVRIARASGVELIFVEPVSNLKDFSPFKSEHGGALSAAQTADVEQLLARGRDLRDRGRPEEALEALERAAAADPEYAESRFRLGRCLFALGRYEEARAALVRAKDLDVAPLRAPERIVGLVREVAVATGVPRIELPAVLEADAAATLGHRILGNEFLLDHVHPDIPVHSRIAEEVLEHLARAGVVRPDAGWGPARRQAIYDRLVGSIDRSYYAERDLNLAKVLGWAGKIDEAEAPLLRAAEVLTDRAEVYLSLGIVHQKQGRLEEASRELVRAIELDPASPEAHFNLGVVWGGLGRTEDAVGELRRALELRPDYADAQYNLGVLELAEAAPERAVAALLRAVELKPGSAAAHAQLGWAYRELRRWEEAVAAFRRALELAPREASALVGLGGAYGRLGRLDEAEAALTEAIEIDPTDARARFDLGVLLTQRDRPQAAIAAYRQAVALDPEKAEAFNNLGILLGRAAELEPARQALQRAIEIDPDYAEAHFNLGIVYDAGGRGDEAIRAIERAVALEPAAGRFHLALGMLLQARGLNDRARFHLRQAEQAGELPAPAPAAPPPAPAGQ